MWFGSIFHSRHTGTGGPRSVPKGSINGARRPATRNAIRLACHEVLEARRLLSFAPAVNYAANGPRGIDAGDFNGDGDLDLVTANVSGIGVRLNNGDGTFGSEATQSIGGHTGLDAVVGDVNADGKLDLVASTQSFRISGYYYGYYGGRYPIYQSVGHVQVLLGNGDGTFASSGETADLGDGYFPSVAIGDLDEDGDADAVLSNWQSSELTVLPGDGDGTFGAPQRVAVGPTPQDVSIADVDGDTELDLVTTSLYADVKVVLGNGDGTFQPAQSVDPGGTYAQGHVVGDVNGDGKLDLVVTTQIITPGTGYGYYYYPGTSEGRVNVLLGNGDGTFGAASSYWADWSGLEPVALADFDGDGEIDIAAASYNSGNVNILHGNGDGTFGAPEAMSIGAGGGGPADIVVGDFDGDGKPDVATANFGYNTVSVFLNGFVPPPALSVGDATVTEGEAGTVNAVFTVTLSRASTGTVTVGYATNASGIAVAGRDFNAASGTLTFLPGETSKQISVAARGDAIDEYDETFTVDLSGASNASVADGQGLGTIVDNDAAPTLVISNVTNGEGRRGSTSFDFVVSLSAASEKDVSVNFATANGTATAGADYVGRSGTLNFVAGQTSQVVRISVLGDRTREASETFFVNLSGANNTVIGDAQGLGTILDDDTRGNKKN